jgi:Dullard-like phosphatase family protein
MLSRQIRQNNSGQSPKTTTAKCCTPNYLLPPQSASKKGLMTVVLDMDETMIHSDFVGCSEKEYKKMESLQGLPPSDFFLDVCDGVAVYIRPGLSHFLKLLNQLFEVVVFTAGEKDYADAVLDYVDPQGFISHRLYRDSTCEFRNLNYVKDLNMLGRDMARTVLLDNNMVSMAATPDNCILIDDFFTDKSDRELPLVASILMDLGDVKDVRPILRDAFAIRETVASRFFNEGQASEEDEAEVEPSSNFSDYSSEFTDVSSVWSSSQDTDLDETFLDRLNQLSTH